MDADELLKDLQAFPNEIDEIAYPNLPENLENHRKQLSILASTGKLKEFVGSNLTHDDVKKLSEQDVEKYYKRYQAALASRVTETLVDGFLKLACKAVGLAICECPGKIAIDSTEKLHEDLKEDYIIQQELTSVAGLLSLKCGRLMALASAVLHTVNHIVLDSDLQDISQIKPSISMPK